MVSTFRSEKGSQPQTEKGISSFLRWRYTITARFTLMSLLVITGLLLILGGSLIFIANRSQRGQVRAAQQGIAAITALTLELYLEDVERNLVEFVRRPDLITMRETELKASLQNLLEYRIDYVTYKGVFEEVALLTPTGSEVVKLSNTRMITPADFTNRAQEEAFRRAMLGENYFGPVHRLPWSPSPVVTLAVPILGTEIQPQGATIVELSVARMWETVLPIKVGKTGYKYLVSADDTLMAADAARLTPGEVVPDHIRSLKPALMADGVAQEYVGVLGGLVVGSVAPVGRTGWKAIAELPTSEAYSGLRHLIFLLIGLLLLSGALAACVAVYVAHRLVRPIHVLQEGARLVGQGQLDHFITVDTQDELAELAGEFNRMSAQLQESYANLEHRVVERTAALADVNQELEAFSYSVSHDLRAPLRSIDGFSQVLLEDYADKLDTQGKDHLQRVRRASQRMGQLIDDMLNLSRVTRSEMLRERAYLSALAQDIAAELQQTAPHRQVEFIIEEGLTAEGDARLLRIALENLIGNAWKFTSNHPRARIELGVTHKDGVQAYFVRDDGAGFDMTHADKLFGAFQRLHSSTEFGGTGIGLATVQRIIHRHGGRVWAEGAVEQGATFYFTLS